METDYKTNGLTGLQIWNSEKDAAFYKGLEKWVQLLLSGHRLYIVAGNDAHGNFGRFRQLQTPFISMAENSKELFAKARTGLLIKGEFSLPPILSSLKNGNIIVTDGPFGNITLTDSMKEFGIGETYARAKGKIRIEAKSSAYFGGLSKIMLFIGDRETQKETQRYKFCLPLGPFDFSIEKFISDLPTKGYIRLSIQSCNGDKKFLCLTNPIFIDHIRTSVSF